MAKESYRKSPLTIAYESLYQEQEKVGRYLTYDEARRKFGATAGIIFSPGTTFQDILDKLERIDLIALDPSKKRVFVMSPGSLEARARHSK